MHKVTITPAGLDALIHELAADGYDVQGPTVQGEAIRLGPIESIADLPRGVTDSQTPGEYRIEQGDSKAFFGHAAAVSTLKPVLFPPRRTVWEASTDENGSWVFSSPDRPHARVAVVGARPCDVAAMRIQDRVFTDQIYTDPDYAARRSNLFVVAVNCTTPAETCFCASMKTGPAVSNGFDLALTELSDQEVFIVEVGSDAGAEMLSRIPHEPVSPDQLEIAASLLEEAAKAMKRSIPIDRVASLLATSRRHHRWSETAERCLACGNCTQVCPTCFCISTEPTSSLDNKKAALERRWDSCFSLDFSYIVGGPVRSTISARYRQWLTHKLSGWVEQFGELGCVGCGRCITWCPVGIDITEEVAAIGAEV